jgi:hypothetical protein
MVEEVNLTSTGWKYFSNTNVNVNDLVEVYVSGD